MTARPAAGRSNGNLIRLYVVYTLVDAGIGGYKLPSINFRYKTLFYPLLHKLLQVFVYCTRSDIPMAW
jgi:hypothetical protein